MLPIVADSYHPESLTGVNDEPFLLKKRKRGKRDLSAVC